MEVGIDINDLGAKQLIALVRQILNIPRHIPRHMSQPVRGSYTRFDRPA
ncbi:MULTISPECIES: hypothetical protein [unclassified Roseateles]|nr:MULTISPECIES: hypothetical protein [unclassified Roseateles]